LQEAVAQAREKARQMKEEGVDQAALDAAAAKGFGNALFEYDEDEVIQVVDEFYPLDDQGKGEEKKNSVFESCLRQHAEAAKAS